MSRAAFKNVQRIKKKCHLTSPCYNKKGERINKLLLFVHSTKSKRECACILHMCHESEGNTGGTICSFQLKKSLYKELSCQFERKSGQASRQAGRQASLAFIEQWIVADAFYWVCSLWSSFLAEYYTAHIPIFARNLSKEFNDSEDIKWFLPGTTKKWKAKINFV